MPDQLRLDAARRAQHLAEAVRRGAAGIDVRAAPQLGTDLIRVASVMAASLSEAARPVPAIRFRRLLLTALTSLEELETLLTIATSLELLGGRGARLEREVRELRLRLRDLRRRPTPDAEGDIRGGGEPAPDRPRGGQAA